MADNQTFTITITAKDGTKQTFQAINSSATQTASNLQKVGTQSQQAMKQAGDGARQTGQSFKDLAKESAAVGSAIGSTIGIMARLGQMHVNEQRQLDALQRVYGTSAEQVANFADRLQELTIYSDDAARASLQMAGSLVQNYGFAADQVEQLVEISADLATVTGMDLADSTERLVAAMRGEAEAAETLGLTLNDASVAAFAAQRGFEGYSTTMSEAERAQVRFLYLQEQASFAMGAAGEYAQTTAGQTRQFVNTLQDLAAQAGSAMGPVGEVLSVLSDVALVLPLIGGAAGAAARGFQAIGRAASAMQLERALAPLTTGWGKLGVAAVGFGIGEAIVQLTGILESGMRSIAEFQSEVTEMSEEFARAMSSVGGAATDEAASLAEHFDELAQFAADNTALFSQLTDIIEGRGEYAGSLEGRTAEESAALMEWQARVVQTTLSIEDLALVQQDLYAIMSNGSVDVAKVDAAFADLLAQLIAGQITADQFVAAVDAMRTGVDQYTVAVDDLTSSYVSQLTAEETLARAQEIATITGEDVTTVLYRMADGGNAYADSLARSIEMDRQYGVASDELKRNLALDEEAWRALEQAATEASDSIVESYRNMLVPMPTDAFDAIVANLDSFVVVGKLSKEQADSIRDGLLGMQLSGASTLEILAGLSEAWYEGNTAAFEMAAGIENAVGALQRLNDIAIGTTKNLSGTIQETADFVDDLFGGDPYDAVGPLVDMLNDGRISQEQFNQTVEAGIGILEDNERAQRAIQEVQADQVPLLQEQTDAYADMMEELAGLPPLEQQRALALMDSATQSDIARLSALAYSAAIGEIPKEAATDIIVSAAEADPVLADLLEQYGLIERGADGEIRVNFPDGDTIQASVESLTASIDALTRALGGVPPAAQDAANALAEFSRIQIRTPGSGGGGAPAPTTISDYEVYNPGAAPEEMPAGTGSAYAYVPAPMVSYPLGTGGTTVVPAPVAALGTEDAAPLTIGINVDTSTLEQRIREIDGELSVWSSDGYEIYVGGDPEAALEAIDEVEGQVTILDETTGEVTIITNTEDYDQDHDRVTAETDDLDKLRATIDIEGQPEDWINDASAADSERKRIDGTRALISVDGDTSGYYNALANLPGNGAILRTYWVAIDVTGPGAQVGYLPYAHGGVVPMATAANGLVLVGENGPELAYLPGGTLISPSPASQEAARRMRGDGNVIEIHYHQNSPVFGMDDFNRSLRDGIGLALDGALAARGMGVR